MKTRIGLLVFLMAWAWGGILKAGQDPVSLDEKKTAKGFLLTLRNHDPYAPYHAVVDFDDLTNLKASLAIPAKLVLEPGASREISLEKADPRRGYSYRTRLAYGFGDPAAELDDTLYLLPYHHGVKHEVVQGYFGAYTHSACRCLDFDLADGEEICAARGGLVVMVKQDSDRGGEDPSFAPYANVVEILHADGTWAAYAHLRQGGARVEAGQKVKAGEVIGLCGATGQVRGPHLHFTVNRATWEGEETLATRFQGKGGEPVTLKEGGFYYSYHPGGREFKESNAAGLAETDVAKRTRPLKGIRDIRLRVEKLDNKVFFFCQNGTNQARPVKVNFRSLTNMKASKPLPVEVLALPGKEIYVLTLEASGTGGNGYQVEYSY